MKNLWSNNHWWTWAIVLCGYDADDDDDVDDADGIDDEDADNFDETK